MEIPTWLFFSFWALTSTTFLHLAFHALDKTQLNSSLSLSPLFIPLLKHALAISSSSSSAYALKYRPQSTHQFPPPSFFILYTILSAILATTADAIFLRATAIALYSRLQSFLLHFQSLFVPFLPILTYLWKIAMGIEISWLVLSLRGEIFSIACSSFMYLLLVIVNLVSAIFSLQWLFGLPIFFLGFLWFSFLASLRFSWHFSILILDAALNFGTGDYEATEETRGRVAVLVILEISLFFVEKTCFSPIAVVLLSHSIAAISAAAARFLEEDGGEWGECLARVKESKVRKLAEFGVGVAGAIVFKRMFFEFTSCYETAAFIYLGAMWLANLTLVGFPSDLGIFYFVVGNAVVWRCSWMACGVALLLVCLRLKLESLVLLYEEDDCIQVGVF